MLFTDLWICQCHCYILQLNSPVFSLQPTLVFQDSSQIFTLSELLGNMIWVSLFSLLAYMVNFIMTLSTLCRTNLGLFFFCLFSFIFPTWILQA